MVIIGFKKWRLEESDYEFCWKNNNLNSFSVDYGMFKMKEKDKQLANPCVVHRTV